MTQATHPRSGLDAEPSGWAVGWTVFAAVMMMVGGTWWIIAGFVALLNDEFYVATAEYVFQFDLTTWGWIHLALGALTIGAGVGLLGGATWARVVGVLLSGLTMLAAFAWLPNYPLWGIMLIATSAFVIWALTAHGRDITEA
jgi:hypothetical protein